MAEEQAVEAWSPETIRDQIAKKIKTAFVEMVPDDAFAGFVQKEIAAFFEATTTPGQGYNGTPTTHPSRFSQIIAGIVEERITEQLKAELEKPEYLEGWLGSDREPSEFVKQLMATLVPEIVKAQFTASTQQVLQAVRQQFNTVNY